MVSTHAFTLPVVRELVPGRPKRRTVRPAPRRRPAGENLAALVDAACTGDDAAWTRLVERFTPLLRRIARGYNLGHADVEDVVQATWVSLFQRIESVRDPLAIAGWLATTARRECLRALQAPVRETLTDDPEIAASATEASPEAAVLAAERRRILVAALTTLPARDRTLLALLISESAPTYKETAAALGVPVGTIGPSRARILGRLERHPALRSLRA